MERRFSRLSEPRRRQAFVEAQARTKLALQIRSLRLERSLTQTQLAKKLGTTQTVISRLEDPSYGRVTMQTLLELANAFDVALDVRFHSVIDAMIEAERPDANLLRVEAYDEESRRVEFVEDGLIATLTHSAPGRFLEMPGSVAGNLVVTDIKAMGTLNGMYKVKRVGQS